MNVPNYIRIIGNYVRTMSTTLLEVSEYEFNVADSSKISLIGGLAEIDYDIPHLREVIYIISKSGNTLTIAANGRGLYGTNEIEHDIGAKVRDFFVDDHINQYIDDRTGWGTELQETFEYASGTTITVDSGAADRFAVGGKFRYKQGGGWKYANIIGVADTLLTVTGGSDYTVSNADITDVYYTQQDNPIGFPHSFSRTPVWTGSSSDPSYGDATVDAKFWLNGSIVHEEIAIIMGATTSYGSGFYYFDFAIAPKVVGSNLMTVLGSGLVHDLGVGNYLVTPVLRTDTTFRMSISGGVDVVSHNIPFTFTTSDRISLNLVYLADF